MSWPTVKLGDIFDIARGGSPRPIKDYISDASDAVNWISIKDASESSKYIRSTKLKIRREGVAKSRLVKPGDFLLTNSMSFGHPYILQTTGCIHDGWLVLSDRNGEVDRDFFFHLLGSEPIYRQFSRLAAGAVVKNLNIDLVESVEVPLPPLPEQRRIADILDKADAIRRKRKQAIALTDELLRSAFLDMFGDPVTNPKGWPTETISELCERGASLVDGPFGSSLKPEHYVSDGIRVVRNWNIHDDWFDTSGFKYVMQSKFEEIRRSEVKPGDVLITTKGTVGDVCLMPSLEGVSVLSASGTVRLRLPQDATYVGSFVVAQMIVPSYKRYLHSFEAGSAQQYLNLSALRKMQLIRPRKHEQERFVRVKEQISKYRADAERVDCEAQGLFTSLVQRAFSGSL